MLIFSDYKTRLTYSHKQWIKNNLHCNWNHLNKKPNPPTICMWKCQTRDYLPPSEAETILNWCTTIEYATHNGHHSKHGIGKHWYINLEPLPTERKFKWTRSEAFVWLGRQQMQCGARVGPFNWLGRTILKFEIGFLVLTYFGNIICLRIFDEILAVYHTAQPW